VVADQRMLIKPLTSLRFFAALMVVAHHYFGFTAGFSGVVFPRTRLFEFALGIAYLPLDPAALTLLAIGLSVILHLAFERPAQRSLLLRYGSTVSRPAPGFA